MATTSVSYVGDGIEVLYSITFPYLRETDILVTLDGVTETGFSFSNETTIQFDVAPGNGVTIVIYRKTATDQAVATYYAGSAIRATDLNNSFNQALYVIQEQANDLITDIGNVTLSANYTFSGAVEFRGAATVPTPTAAGHAVTKAYVDAKYASSGNVSDGSFGDIVVSGGNSVWTIANGAVTSAKILDGTIVQGDLAFTPLEASAIGVTVQAYDADTTKNDVANNFTQLQAFNAGVDVDGSYRQTVEVVAALDIDCSTGNYFTKTISGDSTFTVSNVPASRAYSFTLELTHTSGVVTWFSGVEWPGGTAPTLTTGKTHLFVFVTDDGGTRWRGAALANYTN